MRGALLVVIASGCVVPKKAGFDDVQKALAGRMERRIHWNQGTDEDRRVAEETRRLLSEELTVGSATQIALFNNPQLQATYERLGIAQAEVVQAGLLRNPSISLHWGFRFGSAGADEIFGSIFAPILDLFLMPLKKKLANAEFRRVKLEVANEVLEVVARVHEAFYAAQASTQIIEMRRTMLLAQEAAVELAIEQHNAGTLSDLDLSNEQVVYAQAKLDLQRAQSQLFADREKLTRLLGVWGFDVEYQIAAKLPELPAGEPDLAHLERIAIENRFDLRAAQEEVRTASAALQVTKGTRMISGLTVGVQGHRDPDGPKTIGPTVDLELPIFDQKQAEVARLRALLHAAERRADMLAIAIRSEVREARNRLLSARTSIDYYKHTLVPLRERIVELSHEQYNAMLLGTYQLLQSKQNELNAYREYIETVRDYWIARADLERAIGARLPKGDSK